MILIMVFDNSFLKKIKKQTTKLLIESFLIHSELFLSTNQLFLIFLHQNDFQFSNLIHF